MLGRGILPRPKETYLTFQVLAVLFQVNNKTLMSVILHAFREQVGQVLEHNSGCQEAVVC